MVRSPTTKLLLFAVFTISGFSGLIYESIWTHYLKLFLGHAAYAQTLVLAIFMGGMALGSWIVARRSGSLRNLLLGYVMVEGLIGILGLAFHRSFLAVTDVAFTSVIPHMGSAATIQAFKWTMAALMILPQSILLGMTFPLMSGGIIRRYPERPGEVLSMLYFTNSLGAAIGVLVSGFVLIAAVGLPGTILTAGILNVLLALVVWVLVRQQAEPSPVTLAAAAVTPGGEVRAVLLAAFLTGAASLLYEIGWIRMLSLVLGSSTHAFELMLSAFIFGLAFGGLWIRRRIDLFADSRSFLGVVMMVMGLLALTTLVLYGRTFEFMAQAIAAFSRTESGYAGFNLVSHAIAVLIMVPATFCAGMTLPLMTRSLIQLRYGERAIGNVYAANTLGGIAGVIAAVHLLMPQVGVKGAIILGGAIHVLVGFAYLASAWRGSRPRSLAMAAVAGALAVLWAAMFIQLDPRRMTSGVYRTGVAAQPQDTEVIYHRDGKTATVSLIRTAVGSVVISTNGKPDAAINMAGGEAQPDEVTMTLAAALPLAIHPQPRQVANIGIGSGLTSHVLLTTDQLQELDTVEIERFMAEAAEQGYMPRVQRAFRDPRSRIVFEDAKSFFAASARKYDVIVSEPSNPWVSGVATLFSEEFYRRLVGYMRPGGLLVQWLQIYETDITVLASVIKALSPYFSDYAIYNTDDSNILIVAVRSGELTNPDAAVLQQQELARELQHVGIRSVQDIENRRLGTKRMLEPLFQSYPVPANSDFFPFVDLNAPRMRFLRRDALDLIALGRLPVPAVEMLDRSRTPRVQTQLGGARLFFRDTLTAQALAIVKALATGDLRSLPTPVAQNVLTLGMSDSQCHDEDHRKIWRASVYDLFAQMLPFLTPGELAGAWRIVTAGACYPLIEGEERAWLELIKAVADRDGAAMASAGGRLLHSEAVPTNPDQLGFVLVATVTGHLASDDVTGAQRVWAEFGARLPRSTQFELALHWLLALSYPGQQISTRR